MEPFEVHPDVARARTLPGAVYSEPAWYDLARERVLVRGWHVVGSERDVPEPGRVAPATLLPGSLDEPLVLTRDAEGRRRCLSNACTHRGNLVASRPGPAGGLRCGYHGRRFGLDGRCLSQPTMDGAEGFPGPEDDLPGLPVERWGPFWFTSLAPAAPFAEVVAPLEERLGWLPWDRFEPDPAASRDYEVAASWALYLDNYLEGLHIPFVHGGLAAVLDWDAYATETYPWASLQLGVAEDEEDAFDLPPGHPDEGRRIAGYYYCVFPTTLFNFYPWGLSLNLVRPLGPRRTRLQFRTWVLDRSRLGRGAGAGLHQVELEDEAVVEATQRGVAARLYHRGRYSPRHERGVHWFHRLVARLLQEG